MVDANLVPVGRPNEGHETPSCNCGQDFYYSPNSTVLTRPLPEPHWTNPFQPNGTRSSGARYCDLLYPRPWSKAFGWTSFIPIEPCYAGSPRSILSILCRPPQVEHHIDEGNGRHSFCLAVGNEWRTLEQNIYDAVCALKGAFHLPCVLPFLPHTLGYNAKHPHKSYLQQCIQDSRDWFLVWVGALSYCLYASEADPHDHNPRREQPYPRWRKALEDAGLSSAWVDQLVNSPVVNYHSVRRVGCIIDILHPDPWQPNATWFLQSGVPVWYHWCNEQEKNASNNPTIRALRPPDASVLSAAYVGLPSMRFKEAPAHLQTDIGDYMKQRNERIVGLGDAESQLAGRWTPEWMEEGLRVKGQSKAAEAKLVKHGETEWMAFFNEREATHASIVSKETPKERKRRFDRTRNPPTSSAPVFEWTLDPTSNVEVWIRVPVPAKWRSDTLEGYGTNRKRYDPFYNEWDCCDEFGDITEEEEEEMDSWGCSHEPPPLPHPYPSLLVDQVPADPPPSKGDVTLSAMDPPPALYHPEDPVGQEIEEVFGYFYGYVAPVSGTPIPEQRDERRRDIFFRLLGQVHAISDTQRLAFLTTKPYLPAQFLVDCILDRTANVSGVWDLHDDCVSPVRLRHRFRRLWRIPPNGKMQQNGGESASDQVDTFYVLRSDSTATWELVFISAAAALTACRLPENLTPSDIVAWFVQRGIPFRIFYHSQPVSRPIDRPMPKFTIPVRPFNHKFTKEDYDSYIHLRTIILGQPHMQAALKRGGIVWRLSIGTLGISSVHRPPSQWHLSCRVKIGEREYVDDVLAMNELDLICGAYECVSDDGKQRSLKSWWPLARYYEKEECGENYGHWSVRREAWYKARLLSIEKDDFSAKPLTYTEWKSTQHGPRLIRCFHSNIEKNSLDIIAKYGAGCV